MPLPAEIATQLQQFNQAGNNQMYIETVRDAWRSGAISDAEATELMAGRGGEQGAIQQWRTEFGGGPDRLPAQGATTSAAAPGGPGPALSALIESPQEFGDFIAGDSYTLPDSPAAATGLRGLQTAGVTGLLDMLASGEDEARRKAVEDALFERSMEDINRANTDLRQGIRESNFGRGMGVSTVTGDDLGRLEKERLDAVSRARREAVLTSGEEARAASAARLAALGQAFGSGTTGLQAEANVGLTNTGRGQQARTSAAQIGSQSLLSRLTREQQGGQFGRELESREKLFEKGRESAERIAGENRTAAGIGAGIGGVANVFGPSLDLLLRRQFGVG